MSKIKTNKEAESRILMVSMINKIRKITSEELLDIVVEEYKKAESLKIFTAEETDSIIRALESMPGYSAEKLLTAYMFTNITIDNMVKVFEGVLLSLYLTLSITNPEIFEKYEEKNNG